MISMAGAQRTLARTLPPWWLFLVTGVGWTLVGLILLRFDYTSVSAIAILFGIVAIAAGLLEIGVTMLAAGWGKLLHAVLAFLISIRHEMEVWWLQLIGGIIELALGFWAAGYYGRSAVLLIAWVAAFTIIRGVRDIVFAFRVREVQHGVPGEALT